MATRIPENLRGWMCGTYCHEFEYFPTQPAASLSDMVFGFLEDGEGLPGSISSEEGCGEIENFDEDEEKDDIGNVEEDKSYWENQHQILQVLKLSTVLFHYTLYIVNISLWGPLKYVMSLDSKAHLFLVYFVSTFL